MIKIVDGEDKMNNLKNKLKKITNSNAILMEKVLNKNSRPNLITDNLW